MNFAHISTLMKTKQCHTPRPNSPCNATLPTNEIPTSVTQPPPSCNFNNLQYSNTLHSYYQKRLVRAVAGDGGSARLSSNSDRNIVHIRARSSNGTIQAEYRSRQDSRPNRSRWVNAHKEGDRSENVGVSRAKVFGVDDRAKRLRVSFPVSNTESSGNVVDGLDVVGGVEGDGEGLSGSDG